MEQRDLSMEQDVHKLIVSGRQDSRLDSFISRNLTKVSRSYVQNLIKTGHVTVNDTVIVHKGYQIHDKDEILISVPEPSNLNIESQDIDLDIKFEDEYLIVLNKPRQLVVHPAHGHFSDTLVNGLLGHTKFLSNINGVLRPGIVHRIDKDTTGLLVIAKTQEVHIDLAEQFRNHQITRRYKVLVHGNVIQNVGTINLNICRSNSGNNADRKKMIVSERGKKAITHFKILERFQVNKHEYTYLNCRLETGRTHQIRVHLAHINHPVVGDKVYGPKNEIPLVGQLLHAYKLGFIHPVTKIYMEFDQELPQDFADFLIDL